MFRKKTHVLLVDDEKDFVEMLRRALQVEGVRVTPAFSGSEGFDRVVNGRFDVAILDLKMPHMDGMEVLRRIRKTTTTTEVIILTAYGSVKSSVESMKTGAFDYIEKPVDIKELLLRIEAARTHKELIEERKHNEEARMMLNVSRKGRRRLLPI